jgi:iron complex transport system ATP-binding protein
MRIIQLSSVSWRQGQNTILSDINWDIESGEHWAIIGVNGSGKTSLLNLVNGYVWPTKGAIEVLGYRYGKTNLEQVRKYIGWVSISLADKILVNHANELAIDIVVSGKFASIGMWVKKDVSDYDEAAHVLEMFHSEHLANKPFRILSQGEKQRILIARAWMAKPKLLILDEPCTGLDIKNREFLLQSISELKNQKDCPTLIYVTHHVEEVLPMFNRVLILKNGSILASGEKSKVLTSKNLSVAFDIEVNVAWQAERPWVFVPGNLEPSLS